MIDPALASNYLSVANDTDAAAVARRQRRSLASVRALFEAGVPIVAGTDGAVPGFSLLRNLEQLVAAGLSPMDALRAATSVPARVMGVLDIVGTIEPGKRADLLVLEANPLEDIANIRRTRWVVANGVMYQPDGLRQAAGFRH
jgi:imidazolonepropionase-like amidohydrolase